MNKDLRTEINMVVDRAIYKRSNKMSYFDGARHILYSYLFIRSAWYKEYIKRREAGIFRGLQVSKLAVRGNGSKKDAKINSLSLSCGLAIKNYVRNMWFGWSVHWNDQSDKRFLVRLRFHIYHYLYKKIDSLNF